MCDCLGVDELIVGLGDSIAIVVEGITGVLVAVGGKTAIFKQLVASVSVIHNNNFCKIFINCIPVMLERHRNILIIKPTAPHKTYGTMPYR